MNQKAIFEKYNVVKMNVQLKEAFLEDVLIDKRREVTDGNYTNEISFATKIEKVTENLTKGYLKTIVEVRNMESNENDIIIDVVYSGLFEANSAFNESEMPLEEWVDYQVVPQLLPYSRAIITTMTAHMDIPPIKLPTMDILNSIKENQLEGKEADGK